VTATVGDGLMRLRRWASKDIGFPLEFDGRTRRVAALF
jgi:hypothetical protein